jgi:hypothetical protein
MGYSIAIPNGILSMCYDEFDCPACTCHHTGKDYEDRLFKSKRGLIYKKCKGCKTKLGITTDYKGDVHVWVKNNDSKQQGQ